MIEVFSRIFGIIGAWILFSGLEIILQGSLTICTFILNADRWAWLLGLREHPPESVSKLRRLKNN